MKRLSDQELVGLAQLELPYNTHAFETLLNRYQEKIYNTCKRILNDDHLAEDATQNAMLKIFHYLKDFEQKSSFYTWAYKIACNESLQIIYKNRKYKVLDYNDELHISYDNKEKLVEVENLLSKLDNDEQVLIMLKYFSELKDKEISEILKVNLSTVKMRIKRLKERCENI